MSFCDRSPTIGSFHVRLNVGVNDQEKDSVNTGNCIMLHGRVARVVRRRGVSYQGR